MAATAPPARTPSRPVSAVAVVAAVALVLAACGGSDDAEGSGRAASTTTETTPTTTTTELVAPAGPLVIAHRGASGSAPEHTFAAYDLAVGQGADYLEQDLQLTADGVLVVLHDETLDRTARGPAESCTGLVSQRTLAQIQQCDAGSWFNEAHPDRADPAFAHLRIPTMQQVLERYGTDVRYYVELKADESGTGMEEPLLDLLEAAGLLEPTGLSRPVIIQSFGAEVLERVHELRPEVPLVMLLPLTGAPVDPSVLDRASGFAIGVGPSSHDVDAAFVEAAHTRCLEVHPYTVDDPAAMGQLLDLGVDGLFTNEPAVLRNVVSGRPAPAPPCPDTSG